jgi:hypothetical protein
VVAATKVTGNVVAGAGAAAEAEAPPKPSAGVSLWHKIFGSPAEQAAKLTEQADDAEHVEIAESIAETIPERETSWSPTADELHSTPPSAAERAAAEMETGIETGDESVGSEEDEQRGRGRPRRRRRGRGGSGGRDGERGGERRPSGRRGPDASERIVSSPSHDDDFDDLGVEQDDVELGADRTDSNGIEYDADDDLGDDADGESAERSADGRGHRSIPSWDEAIGMIVESNLQSRSQRRPPSHSGRRGGSSRGGSSRGGSSRGGRSRGGRRHNNPQNGQ